MKCSLKERHHLLTSTLTERSREVLARTSSEVDFSLTRRVKKLFSNQFGISPDWFGDSRCGSILQLTEMLLQTIINSHSHFSAKWLLFRKSNVSQIDLQDFNPIGRKSLPEVRRQFKIRLLKTSWSDSKCFELSWKEHSLTSSEGLQVFPLMTSQPLYQWAESRFTTQRGRVHRFLHFITLS